MHQPHACCPAFVGCKPCTIKGFIPSLRVKNIPCVAKPCGLLLDFVANGVATAFYAKLHVLYAVDGPSDNLAVIVNTSGWQEWLLELLLDGSPCVAANTDRLHSRPTPVEGDARANSNTHAAWEWVGKESQDIRAMLRALHGYCMQHRPRGWTALEQTACHLRYALACQEIISSSKHYM